MKMIVHVPTNRVVGCHMVRREGRAGGRAEDEWIVGLAGGRQW